MIEYDFLYVFSSQVASSPSDFFALLGGSRSKRAAKKASDSQSENVIETVVLQIEGFVTVDIKEVFDVKTKAFKWAELQESFNRNPAGRSWLGIMRIRCSSRGHAVFSHNIFTRSE